MMHGFGLEVPNPFPFSAGAREPLIRRFRTTDRENVRKLCCDNGYLGSPIDAAFNDRSLFAAIFVDPYLDHYPDWTFVAEHDRAIVGYLTAAIGPKHFSQQAVAGCLAFYRLLSGSFVKNDVEAAKDRSFLSWLLFRSWRERVHRPSILTHMHFCIQPAHRGRFLAQRLWNEFECQLRVHGIQHYYGEVITARPQQVARVYGRYGLTLYDQTPSTMFAHVDSRQVWSMCIVK